MLWIHEAMTHAVSCAVVFGDEPSNRHFWLKGKRFPTNPVNCCCISALVIRAGLAELTAAADFRRA